ncbi:hypothetical protein EAH75_01360 [Rhodanobacter glycinis]|uniref:hypothetical protein n=1 Tax=Rhodanobacter glycinis TaxID=582702 RepID=UPI00112C2CC2|nr:hypothetical protein [Rhodanobacter glycinis]TPG50173.1 hypothetical protein EAH75_01360 [Rhodanobacter glycinis]
MIQIKETGPYRAAHEIAGVMIAQGGEWIVNAIDDEGYIMARVGSRYADMLQRSGSPSLVGPFNAKWKLSFIAGDLRDAQRLGGVVDTQAPADQATTVKMAKVLRDGPMTVVAAANILGLHQRTALTVITGLVRRGMARRTGKAVTGRSGRNPCLYEAA